MEDTTNYSVAGFLGHLKEPMAACKDPIEFASKLKVCPSNLYFF